MVAVKLNRGVYTEGLDRLVEAAPGDESYLDQFEVDFPDGLNTASSLEICRVIQNSELEDRIRLLKICILNKNVKVKCPNGDTESFMLTTPDGSLDGFDLFRKEPLALWALADIVYGYVLKKSIRPSRASQAEAGQAGK